MRINRALFVVVPAQAGTQRRVGFEGNVTGSPRSQGRRAMGWSC